jgi:hypothetical protein
MIALAPLPSVAVRFGRSGRHHLRRASASATVVPFFVYARLSRRASGSRRAHVRAPAASFWRRCKSAIDGVPFATNGCPGCVHLAALRGLGNYPLRPSAELLPRCAIPARDRAGCRVRHRTRNGRREPPPANRSPRHAFAAPGGSARDLWHAYGSAARRCVARPGRRAAHHLFRSRGRKRAAAEVGGWRHIDRLWAGARRSSGILRPPPSRPTTKAGRRLSSSISAERRSRRRLQTCCAFGLPGVLKAYSDRSPSGACRRSTCSSRTARCHPPARSLVQISVRQPSGRPKTKPPACNRWAGYRDGRFDLVETY